jgi:hypothetical protein
MIQNASHPEWRNIPSFKIGFNHASGSQDVIVAFPISLDVIVTFSELPKITQTYIFLVAI